MLCTPGSPTVSPSSCPSPEQLCRSHTECANRAAPSRGIPKAQRGLLPSLRAGRGALGRWREALSAQHLPALPGSPEGAVERKDQQKEPGLCPPAPPCRISVRDSLHTGSDQERAQRRLGCFVPRHCPRFRNAWHLFSSVTEAGSPVLQIQN